MAKRRDGGVRIDLENPPAAAAPAAPDYAGTKAPETVELAKPVALPAPDEQDQGPGLAEQIARLERETQAAQQAAQQAEALRQQQAREVQTWAVQQQLSTEQAQLDSVLNALAATQGEADGAQSALEQAWSVGDHRAAAEAQRRLAKAEARVTTLETGRDELSRVIEWRKTNPQGQGQPQPQRQQSATVEQVVANIPGLLPSERDWLRRHPDAIQDATLQPTAMKAQRQGLERGTEEFFRYVEEQMGYREDPESSWVDGSDNRPIAAAPVSRVSPGVSQRSSPESERFVNLTPEQREAAKISHVSEFEYAKGLQRLRAAKRNGSLQE